MCMNKECPVFDICYRAQAEPDEFAQSYGGFKWVVGSGCTGFWADGGRLAEMKDNSGRYIELVGTYGKTIW